MAAYIIPKASVSFNTDFVVKTTKKEKDQVYSDITMLVSTIMEKDKDIHMNDILFYFDKGSTKLDLVAIAIRLKSIKLLELAMTFRYRFGEKSMFSPTLGKRMTPLQYFLKEKEDDEKFLKKLIEFSSKHDSHFIIDKTKSRFIREQCKRRLR